MTAIVKSLKTGKVVKKIPNVINMTQALVHVGNNKFALCYAIDTTDATIAIRQDEYEVQLK